MRLLFLSAFILGLVLGVVSMIAGIDRNRSRGRWIKYVNLPTAGVIATVFGLVGYPLANYSRLSPPFMLSIAGGAALIAGAGMILLIAGWAVPSAAREVEDQRYLLQGCPARVTRAVAPAEPGEIAFEFEGRQQKLRACSLDGKLIPLSAEVVIERVEDGVAYVELWTTIARQLELPS